MFNELTNSSCGEMFGKLELRSRYFRPCSLNTSFSVGTSVSTLEQPRIFPNSNIGAANRFRIQKLNIEKVCFNGVGTRKPWLRRQGLDNNKRRQEKGDQENGKRLNRKGVGSGIVSVVIGNEKVSSKCSMKCSAYGGCIPAIFRALDKYKDLDEALMPWEERLSNKERSIILKEQKVWGRALEIFEWFKKKGYELNVIHYNIMLKILGKARKWTYVEKLLDEMMVSGIVPINSTYGVLIDVYSKGGRNDEALQWLVKMSRQGMRPDEMTMGIVVQMYKKSGEFQKADEFFKKWSGGTAVTDSRTENALDDHLSLSSYTFNTLIDTYGKAGQLEEASNFFARMVREGIVPNTITFNTMIHICGNHGKLDEVSSLMQKMKELQCPPNTRTYNILISLHAKHNNIDKASSYFRKMKEACLEPDLVSYRTLLYAYSIRKMIVEAEKLVAEMDERGLEIDEFTQSALTRMYLDAGMLEKSWSWFRRFHLLGNMSTECYSANIDAYGEHGHTLEAENVFTSCREGKKLSVLVFNVMMKAYGIGKNYDKACNLFDSMEIHGIVPDRCSYNSIIQILASADLPETAIPYLRKMKEAGLVNDCTLYCAVISSFLKLGGLEMAEGLYNEMIGYEVQPDIVVYGLLIKGFTDFGNSEKAMGYVNRMKSDDLAGNAVLYKSLIKLYTKVGYLNEAEEIYQMLQSSKLGPDIYSSNCMIDLYSGRSMVKEAEDIFGYLVKSGNANKFSYTLMLCMYKRMGKFEEAVHIAQKMRELGLLSDLLSYNNVLGLYAFLGRIKEVFETFKEMVETSIQPDNYTLRSLGIILIKCGISKTTVGNLRKAWKNDAHNGLQAWSAILSSVLLIEDNDA